MTDVVAAAGNRRARGARAASDADADRAEVTTVSRTVENTSFAEPPAGPEPADAASRSVSSPVTRAPPATTIRAAATDFMEAPGAVTWGR